MIHISSAPCVKPARIVLRIGAPCSGKGVEGKALKHFHGGLHFNTLTMREAISAKAEQCEDFREIANQCEVEGKLIPPKEIQKLLKELPKFFLFPKDVLFFDGVPRDAHQVEMVKKVFPNSKIIVSESIASDEYLLEVFRATLNADDRAQRLDAEESIHQKRVETYKQHLPAIKKAIRDAGWPHIVHRVESPLKKRLIHLERVAGLHPVQKNLLRNLEQKIGLKPLNLHNLVAA